MHGIVILLLALLEVAYFKVLMAKNVDEITAKLIDRVFKPLSIQHAELESTTFGKTERVRLAVYNPCSLAGASAMFLDTYKKQRIFKKKIFTCRGSHERSYNQIRRWPLLSRYPNKVVLKTTLPLATASVHRRIATCSNLASSGDAGDSGTNKSLDSIWNVRGLKMEIDRLILRSQKKIGKAIARLNKAEQEMDRLTSSSSATPEELNNCPDVDALELELTELQSRLKKLQTLEALMPTVKKNDCRLPEEIATLALELGVDDKPPVRPPKGPKKTKVKAKVGGPRLPYRRYYSDEKIEIRVGKQAEDNDELSLSSEHREQNDWWMHASGCPGSHVVIRCQDPVLNKEVLQDAAALAARQSKCTGKIIKVDLTRCRDVAKPRGAKAGLVRLTGNVQTVKVNMKEAEARLARLDATALT